MTRLSVGDRVHVAGLGTGIVRETRNGGRYLIELKGRSMVVGADQLAAADRTPQRRKTLRPAEEAPGDAAPAGPEKCTSLDLHGKTVIEALEALEVFLNGALLDGMTEAIVIHGRSGGKLKAAVHQRLKQFSAVRAFRLDPRNPGVTIIRLA
jgi:DNA mismatch repair protein MutS2